MILILSFSTTAFANGDGTEQKNSEIDFQEYALCFMRESQSDKDIRLEHFIPMYDTNAQITGYYATFLNGEDKAGYVVLSMISGDNPVVEFSFEQGGPLEEYFNGKSVETASIGDMSVDVGSDVAEKKYYILELMVFTFLLLMRNTILSWTKNRLMFLGYRKNLRLFQVLLMKIQVMELYRGWMQILIQIPYIKFLTLVWEQIIG